MQSLVTKALAAGNPSVFIASPLTRLMIVFARCLLAGSIICVLLASYSYLGAEVS